MDSQHKKQAAAIEAALFIYGEPISPKQLSKLLAIEEQEVRKGLETLYEALLAEDRGCILVRHGDKVQLATKPEFAALAETLAKQEFAEALTPAALETLAIIMYAAPVSRADIEYIRGVNSSFTVRNLLLRGLIERETDPAKPQSYAYKPAFDAIRQLGISSIEELPDYQKYRDLVANLYHAAQSQQSNPHEAQS